MFNFDPHYTVIEESFKKGEDYSSPNLNQVYTDGSRLSDQERVGSGYVIAEVLSEGLLSQQAREHTT